MYMYLFYRYACTKKSSPEWSDSQCIINGVPMYVYVILLNYCILCRNYAAAKSVQSPPYTTNRLQAPNNSRAFASKDLQYGFI